MVSWCFGIKIDFSEHEYNYDWNNMKKLYKNKHLFI